MPNDRPDNNPTIVDAAINGYDNVATSATNGAENVATATEDATEAVSRATAQNTGIASRSYTAAGRDLSVTFGDVEEMTLAIQDLNRFVAPLIATLAGVATNPDLVASLILSPATGANAEAAALSAAARLTTNLAVTEGLALVTASVVTTYQLADSTLSAAAATLRAEIGITGSMFGGLSGVTGSALTAGAQTAGSAIEGLWGYSVAAVDLVATGLTLPPLLLGLAAAGIGAVQMGILTEAGESFDAAVLESRDNPWDITAFGAQVGQNVTEHFSWSDAWANTAGDFQGALGATGPLYDGILGLLIHDGHTLGMFRDGQAHLGDAGLTEAEIESLNKNSADSTGISVYGDQGSLRLDEQKRILPTDLASLFGGARQIDAVGGSDFADIRIIQSGEGKDATYIVQIPSTQSWSPLSGSAPNDLTSDLYAMRYGDNTALARAVFQAMDDAGIASGPDGPAVMLTGFSLGGITAGAMAADPQGYNIEQVVTAGSPIGGMHIPSTTNVTAFEARQDAVPTLDGTANPSSWTTVHLNGPTLVDEDPSTTMSPDNVHDANRYAAMANGSPTLSNDPGIAKFFSGSLSATDYYASRQ